DYYCCSYTTRSSFLF
nr:immunoglobulin light chain junction region [Macaca mulatta]MOY17229.1 immunoglobulin light chain junction region [Macaca mulatta]